MPGDAPAVEFVRFVSSVEGRTVSRWDAPGAYFGAKVATLEERKAGATPVIWDEERVTPLTAQFCARYERELRNALKNGDLKDRKREEYEAWLKVEEKREAEHLKRLEAAAAPAETTVEAPVETPAEPTNSTPPSEAETKPEGRKKKQ